MFRGFSFRGTNPFATVKLRPTTTNDRSAPRMLWSSRTSSRRTSFCTVLEKVKCFMFCRKPESVQNHLKVLVQYLAFVELRMIFCFLMRERLRCGGEDQYQPGNGWLCKKTQRPGNINSISQNVLILEASLVLSHLHVCEWCKEPKAKLRKSLHRGAWSSEVTSWGCVESHVISHVRNSHMVELRDLWCQAWSWQSCQGPVRVPPLILHGCFRRSRARAPRRTSPHCVPCCAHSKVVHLMSRVSQIEFDRNECRNCQIWLWPIL